MAWSTKEIKKRKSRIDSYMSNLKRKKSPKDHSLGDFREIRSNNIDSSVFLSFDNLELTAPYHFAQDR